MNRKHYEAHLMIIKTDETPLGKAATCQASREFSTESKIEAGNVWSTAVKKPKRDEHGRHAELHRILVVHTFSHAVSHKLL